MDTEPERVPHQGGPLSDHVYRELLQAIEAGDYAGRSRLPSEADMATYFQVSRPVLRQALDRLKVEGVIHSTRGSGNFVARGQQATLSFAPLQTIPDVKRCLEFRCVLESEAAATAAEHRSAEDMARIQAAYVRLQKGDMDGDEAIDADFDFHMAISEATQSQYYVQCLKALRPHIVFGIGLIRSLSPSNASVRLKRVHNEHQLIVSAIESRNSKAARSAMANHLQAGIDRFFT